MGNRWSILLTIYGLKRKVRGYSIMFSAIFSKQIFVIIVQWLQQVILGGLQKLQNVKNVKLITSLYERQRSPKNYSMD